MPKHLITQGYGEQFLKIPTVAAERAKTAGSPPKHHLPAAYVSGSVAVAHTKGARHAGALLYPSQGIVRMQSTNHLFQRAP